MAARIDALLRAYQGEVPGASVLVLRNGSPAFRGSYGLADLENRVAATPSTNFRLASMTKQFTAAAILLLAEDRRLTLDDPVRNWLPLPDAAAAMTLRHLLSHTSGLVDYEDLIPDGTTAQLRDDDVLQLLESQNRTYFAPGAQYRYSNSAFALLSLVVRRASGKEFAAFLHERIFAPLQMRTTVFAARDSSVAHRAYGYSRVRQRWSRNDQSPSSAVQGDGGLYSSIDDLALWDAALDDDRLLSAESLRLAFRPATPTEDPMVHYGFGWRITGETQWHSGETVGFRNVILRYPRRRLTVIVLTNRDHPEPYPAALEIAKCFAPTVDATRAARSAAGPDSGRPP